jgi:starch synthase
LYLQAGITVADRLVTVSPGYAEEIRTWLGGWGMEGMIDARGPVLNGIVNGIDDE